MIRTNENVVVNRPVNEVAGFVSDGQNVGKWIPGVSDAHMNGPVAVGSQLTYDQTFLGKRDKWTLELTGYEPNKSLATKSVSGPFPITYHWGFEPVGNGTRVTAHVESEPGGFFKLAEPLVAVVARRTLRASLETLKDLLEAEAFVAS